MFLVKGFLKEEMRCQQKFKKWRNEFVGLCNSFVIVVVKGKLPGKIIINFDSNCIKRINVTK